MVGGEPADVAKAERVFEQLTALMREGYKLGRGDVKTAGQLVAQDEQVALRDYFVRGAQTRTSGRKQILPKSVNQRRYLEAIDQHDIVFGIGPAGTGKTYLAMAEAVLFLLAKKVTRIILVRPAVEAGEKLGFLPGDLQEKVNPYLRPLYDALYDMLDTERVERLIERGTIEIAPLAFMRGRTLNDAFVILDEAQNTTSDQMKMFLTRLGFGSKAVITGDITQIDLPAGRVSGLVEAMRVVGNVEGIAFVRFDERDVVRHPLVQQIVKAYEQVQLWKMIRVSVVDAAGRAARAPGLARWLGRVAPARARGTVTVALVSDARVRALNRRYRKKDASTDVLSFGGGGRLRAEGASASRAEALAEAGAPRASNNADRQLGDIVIATGVAARQAREHGHPLTVELRILALHGLLHLLGYDHETDTGQMAELERRLRRKGGLIQGLTERGRASGRA